MSHSTLQPDATDDLLSDFFKSEMRHPWPPAPVPNSVEPARSPARRPAPALSDQGVRARLTLAASVALLLGTCWYLSTGWSSGDTPTAKQGRGSGPDVLPDSTAKTPAAFEKQRQDEARKTKNPMAGFPLP